MYHTNDSLKSLDEKIEVGMILKHTTFGEMVKVVEITRPSDKNYTLVKVQFENGTTDITPLGYLIEVAEKFRVFNGQEQTEPMIGCEVPPVLEIGCKKPPKVTDKNGVEIEPGYLVKRISMIDGNPSKLTHVVECVEQMPDGHYAVITTSNIAMPCHHLMVMVPYCLSETEGA